jgi:hypothetical protein
MDKKTATVYRLEPEILLAEPKQNFKLWDDSEINELLGFLDQFVRENDNYVNNKHYQNYTDNWHNCAKAIDYYNNEICVNYVVQPGVDLPLKQAIREGKARRTLYHLVEKKNRDDELFQDMVDDFMVELKKRDENLM